MKLRPEQLGRHLQESLLPMYWIAGDEPLLVQEACDSVRQACRQKQFSDTEQYFVEAGFDWNTLLYSGNSLSLFSERKLIELRLRSSKLDNAAKQALQSYLQTPNPDNLLLIISPKLEAASQKTKWFQAIESKGAFLPVWPVDASQLPRWIAERLKMKKLSADPDAVMLLAERVEGNLLAASQEIEKLELLLLDRSASEKHLDAKTISTLVADSARYNVFGMLDHALSGNARKALKSLHGLRNEGAEPLMIAAMIARELRTLAHIAARLEKGESLSAALKAERIWGNRQAGVQAAAQRLSARRAQQLLQSVRKVDHAVKGLGGDSVWPELDMLLLALSGQQTALSP